VAFGYGRLRILPEIELLVNGERIFDFFVVGQLDKLSRYLAMWLS
jgi:hypothetical protein